ncbi:hypothetical protein P3T76_002661 [Phytophthora citrophthora]|uniref:DDE Tnp4 domain-containing protein n=1 Tax=Phytophthora citrophthora TaxID=4793 RepID=A0AAD9GWS5_9STRA|nr:hypothetical protein P3T76_002661 [Phytophthora citrophthora]
MGGVPSHEHHLQQRTKQSLVRGIVQTTREVHRYTCTIINCRLAVVFKNDLKMDSESSSSEDEALVIVALLAGEEKDSVWRDKFRFEKNEILQLVEYLGLEDPFPTTQRYSTSAFEALSIFLRRMAYPARLSDLEDLFGRDTTTISSISNAVLDTIYNKFHGLLQFDDKRLTTATLSAYANAIHAKGAPLKMCVGFIDGTVRGTCRPQKNQRYMFNVNLFARTHHDAFILYESKLLDVATPYLTANDKRFVFYGDPAYGQQEHIIAPFKGASLSEDEQEFNKRMSSVRVSVEWGFGKIVRYWAFIDFSIKTEGLSSAFGKDVCCWCFLDKCPHLHAR